MRVISPPLILALLGAVTSACTQDRQALPFAVDPPDVAQQTIGPAGGLISHPAGISVRFPAGALAAPTKITVFEGQSLAEFPGSPEGELIPGTYFNIVPTDLTLARAIEIDLAIRPETLSEEERVRVGLASGTAGGALETEGVNFDLTSGILHAEVSRMGAVVAVVSTNAVPVEQDAPPTLLGGSFELGGAGSSTASAVSGANPVTFSVECGHSGPVRRCLRSGTIQIWASSEIQERLSGDMVILNPEVRASLEFSDFTGGLPAGARGSLSVTGTLRVRLGQAITSYEIDDTYSTTGPGGVSALDFSGNSFTMQNTSVGPRALLYEIGRSGTGQRLIVRGEETVELENEDGTTTTGRLFLDVRLRG